ncbi:DUF4231 domain-containing protein [Microbispora triticiradicis]|uniref:DUF4231 domain-containing protein n=2 Tax=Microbispora TaxID=2005 RepID=A0ABY3LMU2_9ACTN|nr:MULTISPECIES: DUF4231 domain-containing protein [Microbispora]TLP66548.1 DUF4231 domain-containing protein [Microbispora fusca]TYB43206.1 DUF4231 domain-containing protein [Microbispora tritici]
MSDLVPVPNGETQDERLDEERREAAKAIVQQQSKLRDLTTTRLLQAIWLLASLGAAGFLGSAMFIGVWTNYRTPFTIVGFAAAAVSTAYAAWHLISIRPKISEHVYDLRNLETAQLHLAAKEKADPISALRIYRLIASNDIEELSRYARRNGRYANILQWIVILGSVTATSLSGITVGGVDLPAVRLVTAIASGLVSVAAGVSGFFKFRERRTTQQQTADAMRRHLKAVELRINEYDNEDEKLVLKAFAQNMEELKDEQRKRELQLEESTNKNPTQ